MSSFFKGFGDHAPLNHGLLRSVGAIRQALGQEQLWIRQAPEALEALRQTALIQSTESSNRIEQVTAPPSRIKAIVQGKAAPANRPEQEIAGYRDALATIHTHKSDIPFTPSVLRQLHRDLFQFSPNPGGAWKNADNLITETSPDGIERIRFRAVPAYMTPEAMDELHRAFNEAWEAEEFEKLLLIPAYVLDFLCIHPFRDGNGRMARLLSLLLLYKAGFEVGRYVSLERIVESSKETYYETLEASSVDWHENAHTLIPWTQYFLGVIQKAYHEFEERVGRVRSRRGAKTDQVLDAIRRMAGAFSISELGALCPNVSKEMIRHILQQEKADGRLESSGMGRGATWQKRVIRPGSR